MASWRWGGWLISCCRLTTAEEDLWAMMVAVYELALTRIRLDSTTSYGYHEVTEEGVMQFGPSKDHRVDTGGVGGARGLICDAPATPGETAA